MRFRQAQESSALDPACLIDCAFRGLALWLWSTLRETGQSSMEVGRHRIRTLTASPLHYSTFTVATIDGAIAGALTGRLIPVPYERGDSADLPDVLRATARTRGGRRGLVVSECDLVFPEFRGGWFSASEQSGRYRALGRRAGDLTDRGRGRRRRAQALSPLRLSGMEASPVHTFPRFHGSGRLDIAQERHRSLELAGGGTFVATRATTGHQAGCL